MNLILFIISILSIHPHMRPTIPRLLHLRHPRNLEMNPKAPRSNTRIADASESV